MFPPLSGFPHSGIPQSTSVGPARVPQVSTLTISTFSKALGAPSLGSHTRLESVSGGPRGVKTNPPPPGVSFGGVDCSGTCRLTRLLAKASK